MPGILSHRPGVSTPVLGQASVAFKFAEAPPRASTMKISRPELRALLGI
jgi:hypothetical protein